MKLNYIKKVLYISFLILGIYGLKTFISQKPQIAQGATKEELQAQIDAHNQTIASLEQEIAQYKKELESTSAQAKTLQSAVNTLNVTKKKLTDDLDVTQNKIQTTNLSIQQLAGSINTQEQNIESGKDALATTMRSLNESDDYSPLEILLNYGNTSQFWDEINALGEIQSSIKNKLDDIAVEKAGLQTNLVLTQAQRDHLQELEDSLSDQEKIVAATQEQKNKLLATTKNKESNYIQTIAQKEALEKSFESELLQFQSQLKFIIDPNSVPAAKTGILAWPVDPPHRITQYFGDTDFASSHTALYNGHGHSGLDIGVPLGTPVKAAESGVVEGTGNTDLTCPGASYGNWVFIRHNNGLATLYAHLSVIKAVKGQTVALGDVIGYSGQTGYATGPHLHFTVFASQGVKVLNLPSKGCPGAVYTMPIADISAYLDPLGYLTH